MQPRLTIAVAGAGIGGLGVAIALTLAGHRVQVFDQFDRPRPVGSGLVVQPVGLWVLGWLGAEGRARSLGQPLRGLYGQTVPSGAVALDVRYDAGVPGRHALGIHRASLFAALHDRACALGVPVHPAHPVAGASQSSDAAHVVLSDGRVVGRFDLVVDALGSHSPLSPLTGSQLAWGALWTTLDWPGGCGLPPDRLTQRYRAARQMMGVLPIGRLPGDDRPKVALFWSLHRDGLADWHANPLAAWRNTAMALWPEAAPFVDQITAHDQFTFASYRHGTLTQPWQGRVVQIGDAAHRASPQLGQGANMALLDAAALTMALDRFPVAEAPAAYARMRRAHLIAYQGMSRFLTPQYQSLHRLPALLRDRVFGPLARVWPLTQALARVASGDALPPFAGHPWQDGRPLPPVWAVDASPPQVIGPA